MPLSNFLHCILLLSTYNVIHSMPFVKKADSQQHEKSRYLSLLTEMPKGLLETMRYIPAGIGHFPPFYRGTYRAAAETVDFRLHLLRQ